MINKEIVPVLLNWYKENARSLPWREKRDAYHVWVSEIMLQQTRVEAVKPYFIRFLSRFPTVLDLAQAGEEDLLKQWEGLGYYSRIRNMQKAAKVVVEQYSGQLPNSYEELLKLPGIGPYTAGAIASIAYDIKVPAVDGNALRIVSRIMEWNEDISEPKVVKKYRDSLTEIMPKEAGMFNQALMDLGATICLPNGEPKCLECPLQPFCAAYRNQTQMQLPVKKKAKPRRIEERTILLLESSYGVALRKRMDKGLLAGMYELPALEGKQSKKAVLEYIKKIGYHPLRIQSAEDSVHIFSHIEWHMIAYRLQVDEVSDAQKKDKENDFFFVTAEEIREKYPLPSAFSVYRKYF